MEGCGNAGESRPKRPGGRPCSQSRFPSTPEPMSPPIRVSVITPCFNSATTIRETIQSVLQQNYPEFEHIVMDGGSTDGTLEILKEYPHLLWTSGRDEGLYDAMNKGVARGSGDLEVILNSDDCFRPGALARGAGA